MQSITDDLGYEFEEIDYEGNYWYYYEILNWEIKYITYDGIVWGVEYYLPNEQGLSFYLYLDMFEGKCDSNTCVTKDLLYYFFLDEDETIVTTTLR